MIKFISRYVVLVALFYAIIAVGTGRWNSANWHEDQQMFFIMTSVFLAFPVSLNIEKK